VGAAPDEQEPALQLVYLLRAITVELDLFGAEFARVHDLHPTDVRALIALLEADRADVPATPGWLAARLGLDASSVTALVDRLERLGHVRRSRDVTDRRRVQLQLQDQAHALGWAFFGPLIGEALTAARSLTETELETVQEFLRRMVDVVVAARGTADDARRR
jgi:DNA-binding MarR family transcriptional regulator